MASPDSNTQRIAHGEILGGGSGIHESAQAVDGQSPSRPSQAEAANPLRTTSKVYDIGGCHRDIFWALTCVSLPMLLVTGIFIGLVYANQVASGTDAAENPLGTGLRSDSTVYYVKYSAPRLITVSSWASTAASLTSTFIMGLVSYPVAKSYWRGSRSGPMENLPTTYQLRLIIGALGGGIGALWSWLQYCFWRKRSKQSSILWLSALSLLGATILG